MNNLTNYIKKSIKPKNDTEFCEIEKFDENLFNRMRQDGIMICNSKPKDGIENCEFVKIGNKYLIKKAKRELYWLMNTNNKTFFNWDSSKDPIYKRLVPPPDETVNHALIIKSVIQEVDPFAKEVYIEYGVRSGHNLNEISRYIKEGYGIDLVQPYNILSYNCKFWKCYTDRFSKEILPGLDYYFAFIDADHSFESSYNDFVNLYNYIRPGGYIFLHDTYPCEQRLLTPAGCNDCYKTPIEIKKSFPEAEIVTLPLNPGLSIVRKPNLTKCSC